MTGDEPATVEPATVGPATRETMRPSGLAYVAMTALGLSGVVALWLAAVRLDRASYLSSLLDHTVRYTESEASRYDSRTRGATTAFYLTYVATATVFVAWFSTVIRKLHAARPGDFRFGPGWAVGGWFVPLFNLVQPKLMVDDAWKAAVARERRTPWAVHLWWVLYLIGAALLGVGSELIGDKFGIPRQFLYGERVVASGGAVLAIAAVLAIVVVARLDVAARDVQPAPAEAARWAPPGLVFNPPPGWPAPPSGWAPKPGWQPDPTWPPAPAGWQFWVAVGPN